MAEEIAPATPVIQPITSQDVTAPATSGDNLESQHTADTSKALNDLFDATTATPAAPAPTPTAPTEPTAAPTPTPVAPTPDEFEKRLTDAQPDRVHPNMAKGIEELRRISREEHRARTEAEVKYQEAQAKLAEAETKLQKPEVPEDVKTELEALRNFRREVDLRLDPDFQKQYVTPVKEAEGNILGILREAGLKDEHVDFIEKNGGIVAMSKSMEVLELPNGKSMTAQEWVNDELLGRTPIFHRNRALGELTNALNLQDRGVKELQSFQTNGKDRYEARVKKFTEEFNMGRDGAIAELGEAAQPKQITATMTPEERLAAETHNTRLQQAAARFEEYIKTSQDPKVSGAIVVKATQADVLLASNKELLAENSQLKSELLSIKSAGSTSTAGDNTPPPAPTQQTAKDLLKIGDNKALSALLDGVGVMR